MKRAHVDIDEPVTLDIGGRKFETSMNTLRAQKGSFFEVLLSGRFPGGQRDDGSFFIDRDPTHFQMILDFLTGVDIHFKSLSAPVLVALQAEADFYMLSSLADRLPLFRPGPNYSIDTACRIATKIGRANATVIGPQLRQGETTSVQLVVSSTSNIMIGLGQADLDQETRNYSVSGCYVMQCINGYIYLEDGKIGPYFEGKVRAPSTVGVLLESNGNVFYIIDGIKQARAFTVPVGQRTYHLMVLLYTPGDQVRILPE